MAGNGRKFGALDFKRLLRNFILGGGHKIPILKKSRAPVESAESLEHSDKPPDTTKQQEPPEITDAFLNDDTLSVLRIFVHSVSFHFCCQKSCNIHFFTFVISQFIFHHGLDY